jgi:cell fate regulator YaaT (PSP1 superfamily)
VTLPVWFPDEADAGPAPAPPFLVEVAFKGNRRAFYRCDLDAPPPMGAAVIVEVDRGEDLGRVHSVGARADERSRTVPHGTGGAMPEARLLRLATPADVQRERQLRTEDEGARRAAGAKARAANLDLKISDAEWQFDRRKLTLYFTAEKRIDFRALVRDLASTFRTRIELKQYGVRDEARRLSGIGRCGREYCSASWLPEIRPVNLGVAKDQRLSLNPTQISGACGRLMCCLRYEHDFYVAQRKRFPKEGKIIVTDRGEEKVVAVDIFRERVVLRSPEGEVRTVTLPELAGGPPPTPEVDDAGIEALDPELARLADAEEEDEPPRRRPERSEGPAPRDTNAPPLRSAQGDSTRRRPEPRRRPERSEGPAPRDKDVQPLRSAQGDNNRRRPERSEGPAPRPDAATPDDASERAADGTRRRRRGRRGGRRGKGGAPGTDAPGDTPQS